MEAETEEKALDPNELFYGAVMITGGEHAGKTGLYDDDDHDVCDCEDADVDEDGELLCHVHEDGVERAIVYLWGDGGYELIDFALLKNIDVPDGDEFFKNTMWLSIEASHKATEKAKAMKHAATNPAIIPGVREFHETPKPVVYFLFNQGALVYIGQTKTLARRVAVHRREKTFDAVRCIDVPETKLLETENALIRHYKPALNKNFGELRDYDVDLLKGLGIDIVPEDDGDLFAGIFTQADRDRVKAYMDKEGARP